MTEDNRDPVSRRQAIKRIAAAGTVAWTIPAIQTFNMSRAYAQTQTSPVMVCSWFRITSNDTTPGALDGTCGEAIGPYDSCLSATSDSVDCGPVNATPVTPP